MEIPNTARTIVALEAIRNQLHNLEETFTSMPAVRCISVRTISCRTM